MQKVAACFGPAVRVIQTVAVDFVTGPFSRSARHQRTCNQQAAHQTSFQGWSKECISCMQGWLIGAEAREPVSIGQICVGSEGTGIVRRVSSYFCTYLIRDFGDRFELRPTSAILF
jgi:hypothetical protein